MLLGVFHVFHFPFLRELACSFSPRQCTTSCCALTLEKRKRNDPLPSTKLMKMEKSTCRRYSAQLTTTPFPPNIPLSTRHRTPGRDATYWAQRSSAKRSGWAAARFARVVLQLILPLVVLAAATATTVTTVALIAANGRTQVRMRAASCLLTCLFRRVCPPHSLPDSVKFHLPAPTLTNNNARFPS